MSNTFMATAFQIADLAGHFVRPEVGTFHRAFVAREAVKLPWLRQADYREVAKAVRQIDILEEKILKEWVPVAWKWGDVYAPLVCFTFPGHEPRKYDCVDPRRNAWRGYDVRGLLGVSLLSDVIRMDAHRHSLDEPFVVEVEPLSRKAKIAVMVVFD